MTTTSHFEWCVNNPPHLHESRSQYWLRAVNNNNNRKKPILPWDLVDLMEIIGYETSGDTYERRFELADLEKEANNIIDRLMDLLKNSVFREDDMKGEELKLSMNLILRCLPGATRKSSGAELASILSSFYEDNHPDKLGFTSDAIPRLRRSRFVYNILTNQEVRRNVERNSRFALSNDNKKLLTPSVFLMTDEQKRRRINA